MTYQVTYTSFSYNQHMHKYLQETLHTHKLHRKEDQQTESLIAYLSDSEEFVKPSTSTTNKGLLTNWPLMSSIILFCITCFDDMAYSEVFLLIIILISASCYNLRTHG